MVTRDVAVLPRLARRWRTPRRGDAASGTGEQLVEYADRHRAVGTARDAYVLGDQVVLQRVAFVVSGGREPFPVQDPDRGFRAHDRDLGIRPGEDDRGARAREFKAI